MKSKYEQYYLPADKYVVINDNDPDLRPIVLRLPKPPPIHLIDGYGLKPEDQRFKRLVIPRRLVDLEAEAIEKAKQKHSKDKNKNNTLTLLKVQSVFWELLNDRSKELKKEIDFIRKIWWHRIYGYWCFIKGKPVYLTGRFLFYLNFFKMDTPSNGNRAEYRDCDRREYLFVEYCWTATETFEKLDKQGNAIPEQDRSYKMIDLEERICFGNGQNKNRRRGNTSKSISDGIEISTRTTGTDGFGIQSYSEKNAFAHFDGKVLPAWDDLPIWLKPNSTNNRTLLKFEVGKNDYGEKALNTKIEYATTASSKYFDGQKMKYLLMDEEGKTSGVSVSARWKVNKSTLAQGDGKVIIGYSCHPSTVNEITDGAGDYKYLMESSNFYNRIKSKGQTQSGLFRIFIPAQDGLEGFIDSYGYSVTGEIKDYQKKEGFKQRAEEYLQGERDLLILQNTPESLKKLREHRQEFPMSYADSWMGMSGNVGFDIEGIDNRLIELGRDTVTVRGNLEYIAGKQENGVMFIPDEVNGRFSISKFPEESVSNKMILVNYFNAFTQKTEIHYRPRYPGSITIGVDPFRLGGKAEERIGNSIGKKSKLSDGGITIFWNYDDSIDGGKERSEWKSNKIIGTYRVRSTNTDDFNEDVIKAAIFFDGMIYPETNVVNTYEYVVKCGYGGCLLYDIDKFTGLIKNKPGMDSLERSKQEIFSELRDYIHYHVHREDHEDFLRECKDINGIEQMRFFDILASAGVAMIGAKSSFVDKLKRVNSEPTSLDHFAWW